jgi:hypothetical protein
VAYSATTFEIETVDVVGLIGVVVAVAMFGALGVALARYVPTSAMAPLLAWAFYFWTPPEQPGRWHVVSPFAQPATVGLAFWHVVYLGGLAAVWGAAALLKDGGGRVAAAIGVGGVAAVGASLAVLVPRVCTGGTCLL